VCELKKLIVAGLVVGLLTGCGSAETNNETKDKPTKNQKVETIDKKTSKYPFPKETTPIGDGKVTVTTPAGNSDNGNVPVEFVDKKTSMTQIGVDLENFQGDKQTFIYVDKFFEEAQQVGLRTQTTVALKEDTLKPGIHTVTAVQFEGDEPTGKVLNFTEAKFEIKEGK